MNNQELTALVRDDIVTVGVVFRDSQKTYTFFCHKELAAELKVDDQVLVDTINGVQVVMVVDLEDKIGTGDLNVQTGYRYIFDKVRIEKLDALKAVDSKVRTVIGTHRRKTAKQNLLNSLGVADVDKLDSDVKFYLSQNN